MKRTNQTENYCHYSDLPSPLAYVQIKADSPEQDGAFSGEDIDRIIEMAWEDRTPFDAIEKQFGLREADVKALMKRELKFKSYKRWRERVEACSTKHGKKRNADIDRFKCDRQRSISNNRVSKR